MAHKNETLFRKRVVRDLKLLDNCVIFSIQQRAIRGDPDLLICLNSLFIALELKDEEGECSALQEKRLSDVSEAKGIALVARPSNWKKCFEMLSEISLQNIELLDILKKSH
jgi:hypothetical protein